MQPKMTQFIFLGYFIHIIARTLTHTFQCETMDSEPHCFEMPLRFILRYIKILVQFLRGTLSTGACPNPNPNDLPLWKATLSHRLLEDHHAPCRLWDCRMENSCFDTPLVPISWWGFTLIILKWLGLKLF